MEGDLHYKKQRRLIVFIGIVEFCTINQGAPIVHYYSRIFIWSDTRTFSDNFVL